MSPNSGAEDHAQETDARAPKFYGRRKGKPLRHGRLDAYEAILPAVRIALPNDALDPRQLFDGQHRATWLEIGFGDGEHLLYQARENKDVGLIGCEPFVNGVASLCRGIRDHELENIRVWHDDARLLLPRIKPESIDRCFVLNLDPWPKKRHWKRRFIQKETLDALHYLLKPGAQLRMTTDHPSLAVWELEQAFFHGGFEWSAKTCADWKNRPADLPETRYQKKGAGEGRPTYFMDFIRK